MNIELLDGERIMTAPTNDLDIQKAEFGDLIEDKLGREARVEYEDILYYVEGNGYKEEFESYEASCDEYHSILNDTMNELDSIVDNLETILDKDRLDRQKLNKVLYSLKRTYNNIYNNM